jgi:hypothetical protein
MLKRSHWLQNRKRLPRLSWGNFHRKLLIKKLIARWEKRARFRLVAHGSTVFFPSNLPWIPLELSRRGHSTRPQLWASETFANWNAARLVCFSFSAKNLRLPPWRWFFYSPMSTSIRSFVRAHNAVMARQSDLEAFELVQQSDWAWHWVVEETINSS